MSQEQDDAAMRDVRARIGFGLDARVFMESKIGRFLTAKANADIDLALEELKTADPEKPGEIRRLQNDVKCAENFLNWMGEAVTEGENAERAFIEQAD